MAAVTTSRCPRAQALPVFHGQPGCHDQETAGIAGVAGGAEQASAFPTPGAGDKDRVGSGNADTTGMARTLAGAGNLTTGGDVQTGHGYVDPAASAGPGGLGRNQTMVLQLQVAGLNRPRSRRCLS